MAQPQATWHTSPPADRLRVGEYVVDVPLREIIRPDGSRTRVTLKAISVLLVLAEQSGRVVTRDALLASVWAGTMPTMDVVTQAVAALRKALGGDGESSGYVETIPKTGYRLLASVEWLPRGSLAPSQGPVARGRVRWTALAPVAAVALLVAIAWVRRGWQDVPAPGPAPTADLAYTLLTSRPGREVEPALSPDGASVAYAMSPDPGNPAMAIFVQSTQPIPPRRLTTPPPGHTDLLPRWSPDGRQLMFLRGSDDGQCEVRLMPATGGADQIVGRCDRLSGGSYDWLPDGSGIVAGLRPARSGEPAPLSILRLDSGQWQPMEYPIEPGNVDFDPRFSSDGSRLAFRRNLSRSDIWVMPASGGSVRRITHLRGNITGWDWSRDDSSLFLGVRRGAPRLIRHDIASGRSVALGRVPAASLDVAPHGGNMVFVVDDLRVSMFRYPLPPGEAVGSQPLFPSTGLDVLPSPSPDGRMVAFHSDRSREKRLWIGELENPERLRMVGGFIPISIHPPQWSSDGSRLLVVGETREGEEQSGPHLYEVEVASGRETRLALDGVPYFAQYLPDDRLLALVDPGSGKWSLRILDLASPGRVLAELEDVGEARFDEAGAQVYFVRIDSPGLWRAGLDLRDPTLLHAKEPAIYWDRSWGLLDGKPFVLRPATGCNARWYWMEGASATDAGCLDADRRRMPQLAAVTARDGNWLYASMGTGQDDSDIGMLLLDGSIGAGAATD